MEHEVVRTHANSHTNTLTHTHTRTLAHTHSRTYTRKHTHMQTHTHSYARTHARTHTYAHTHIHTQSHKYAHTHTHTLVHLQTSLLILPVMSNLSSFTTKTPRQSHLFVHENLCRIQTHKRFERTPFIRTKHNMQIFGVNRWIVWCMHVSCIDSDVHSCFEL